MRTATLFLFWVLVGACAAALADGVSGEGRFEKIKGRTDNYIGLYEWDLYLSADGGTTIGQSRRLGAGLGGGRYSINGPAGWYTILVTQPIFFARPTVVTDVQIIYGVNAEDNIVNPELNLDYSCYHVVDGGWSWGTPRYQTFVATGTSIIRIQWMLAGWHADQIAVSVHEDNGGNITTWPQVGPTKSSGVGYGDAWVGFRSGDIPTTPHTTYAIKLTGVGGSPDSDFGIRSRDEDGNGYALGQAYDGAGNPQNVDLHVTVFSDNDGTIIPYIDMTLGSVEDIAGGTGVWGQTFRATNMALAAADCFTAGDGTWDIDVEFRIRQNGPGGAQVGPTKTAQALYQAATCGIVGVSYAPGEVRLTPGNTYFIEMSPAPGSAAFTAYKFNSQSQNGYPYGDAYRNGVLQSNVDLEMTIIEYEPWYAPAIVNPSFEDYGGYLDGWSITEYDGKGPDDPPHSDGAYGVEPPDNGHFAGKITSGQLMDFNMGQIIQVADYDPGSTLVYWSLSANVHLHSRNASPLPDNIHQVWEIGWNDDGSIPAGVNRCDNYEVIADIDGNHTVNDEKYFHPLSANGFVVGITGLEAVAFRVRMYNDTTATWSMSNIDNISFQPLVTPPSPTIELSPEAIEESVWIGNEAANGLFTVTNIGPGTLNYQIQDDVDWLSVSPDSGTSTGESDSINIIYDAADLLADVYTATITVTSPDAWNSPQTLPVTLTVETVSPDFDGDADVDQADFGHFQACLTGPGAAQNAPECLDARLDEDEDVDSEDFTTLQGCLSGAAIPANPQCAGE